MPTRKRTVKPTKGKGRRRGPRARGQRGSGPSVLAPVAVASTQHTIAPQIRNSSSSTRIKHREFVATVFNTQAFGVVGPLPINPGIIGTFPWLSVIAADWEQYTFHKLKFCYVTRCSTSTTGSVILAPDYDPTDPPPENEYAITTYQDAAEDSVWKDFDVVLDPHAMFPLGPRKYVRIGDVFGQDLKTTDAANLYIGTNGGTNAPLGKLWVEYDVELFVPQKQAGPGTPVVPIAKYDVFQATGDAPLQDGVISYDNYTSYVNALGFTQDTDLYPPAAGTYRFDFMQSVICDSDAELYMESAVILNGNPWPGYPLGMDGASFTSSTNGSTSGTLGTSIIVPMAVTDHIRFGMKATVVGAGNLNFGGSQITITQLA